MEQAVNNESIIKQTVAFVKKSLAKAEGGHDWWHVYRVWQLSKHLNQIGRAHV